MKFGCCQDCKELWCAYGQAMTTHVSLLAREELALGGPEWTTVADALAAAATEQDRIRRAIVLHETQVHHRACPLATSTSVGKGQGRRNSTLRPCGSPS